MKRAWDWLVAGVVLLFSRQEQPRERDDGRERIVPAGEPDRSAENAVLLLFLLAGLCAAAFIVFYAIEPPRPIQVMGASLGLAFAFLAAAMIVISKRLVVEEELEEDYSELEHEEDEQAIVQIVEESGSRFTRKRLLWTAGAGAGGMMGLALATPVLSLGPFLDMKPFWSTPWRQGRRLVDEVGRPFTADEIEVGVFYTAFPEGALKDRIGSPLIVVRLEPIQLNLPDGREDWAPDGILAYSKICTHAGCAISIYRYPKFPPVEPRPAFVCPCHYSTFDPATGGEVIFGPAGRPLPQLPLNVGEDGYLRAAGEFSDPVGPSWWGVRIDQGDDV